ncbi:RNA-binding KH domain-containing protein RCF3, partial [Mucuna pruriens]
MESARHAMQDPTPAAESDHRRHHHHHETPSSKRNSHRAKRPVFKVLPGQIAFRLVCHASIVGGLIGSSGSIVSQLRRETGCKIHCEDSPSSAEDRVILVIGSLSPRKGLELGDGEVDVSNAQEAVVRVFERVWELEAEKGVNSNRAVNGEVFSKLLAHTSQIGAVVGKGGKNITAIRNSSGAKIRVCLPPQCAAKDEELVQITGGILAVKKALIAVSHCLQDCPPLCKVPASSSSTPTVSSSDRSSSDPNAELFPHLNSLLTSIEGLSLYDASKRATNTNEASSRDSKGREHEVVFRLLCSNNVAGGVIGKRGAIVRALESKTGASIIFAAPLSEFAERIVTISAIENLDSGNSPAQDAVILVFARIIEDQIGKSVLPISSMESPVTARLLVATSTVNCLRGNEGQVISELKEITGADIHILHGESVPNGASDDDVVVQITGGYRCVQNALYNITCRIRDNLFPNEVIAEARMKPNWKGNKDRVKGKPFSRGKSAFSSGRFLPQNAGVHAETKPANGELHTDLSENLEHGRGNMFATVTNTTVEIIVSEHVFGSVYGEDGGNLDRIRQISGASVTVYDPSVGTSGGKVVISGTPDQTFAAQSLLQAFIKVDK